MKIFRQKIFIVRVHNKKLTKESFKWWAILDSNQRPPQCQCDALPTAPTAHLVIKLSKCDATSRKTCHRQLLLGRVNCANRPLLDFIKVFDFEMRYHPLTNRHLVCLFGRVPTAHLIIKLSKCDATSRKTCHRQLLLGRVNCANLILVLLH